MISQAHNPSIDASELMTDPVSEQNDNIGFAFDIGDAF